MKKTWQICYDGKWVTEERPAQLTADGVAAMKRKWIEPILTPLNDSILISGSTNAGNTGKSSI